MLLLLTSCGSQAKLDAAKLESLLSGNQIDGVEVTVPFTRTNLLIGAAAKLYALVFRETNRVAEADTTKGRVATEVALLSGTNRLAWLGDHRIGPAARRCRSTGTSNTKPTSHSAVEDGSGTAGTDSGGTGCRPA